MHLSGASLSYGTLAAGAAYVGGQLYINRVRRGETNKEILSRYGLSTSVSTAITAGGMLAYKVQNPTYLKASAYIESLNDEQLASLESMLDNKINSMDNTNAKQLVKKL